MSLMEDDFDKKDKRTSATTVFIQKLIREDYESRMQRDLDNLLLHCPEREVSKYLDEHRGFQNLFQQYISDTRDARMKWEEMEPLQRGCLLDYNNFMTPQCDDIRRLLKKLVVIKLNGGLGTRMKCSGPKSLIPVRNELTFLDLTVQQIVNLNADFDTDVPLVLMNSFSTNSQTDDVLSKYHSFKIKIYTFMQSRYPRIYEESLTLLPTSYNDQIDEVWYPPGHGNFYEAFNKSGLLQKFINDGKEYCFVSNIDNLGAIVDFTILNLMVKSTLNPLPDFLMEVTKKTPADVKGGTLIQHKGKLKLLEYAQVPKEYADDFKCTRKFRTFNTNNLWIKLDAMEKRISQDTIRLDVIDNKKQILKDGCKVGIIQLETACGAAIQSFDNAVGLLVPRSRFIPVKTVSDLFLVKSNLYINNNGKLTLNPIRSFPDAPLISLSEEHFGDFKDLGKRFAKIPDCLHLNHLTVSGDVFFGKDVILRGNVTVVANHGERIDIPRGSVLQYKIVTGSLRIVEF